MEKFIPILVLIVCLLLPITKGLPRKDSRLSWDEYKEQYNKSYASSKEDFLRKTIFESRVHEIEQFNSESNSFQEGISHLTDITDEEYMRLNGLSGPENRLKSLNETTSHEILDKVSFYVNRPNYTPPDSVDWTAQSNRVGPVKDQGNCGSCWAFAIAGVLEGQEYKNSTSNNVIELSVQNLVDRYQGNKGCQMGQLSEAVEFIVKQGGLMTEREYPYLSGKQGLRSNCSYDRTKSFVTTWGLDSSFVLPKGDEETLKKVVATYGPVAVGIDASSPHFRDYKSGVYFDERCNKPSKPVNHAVLVVGYGTDKKQGDYWLVKNSWSQAWGEQGYSRLARNRNNHCGVADIATIIV